MQKFLFILLFLFTPVQASDLAKEKRWADQIVDSLIDGEAVWLEAGGQRFLGIFTEADQDNGKAMIVSHGLGVHPNWNQVVYPVRVEMAARGWHTLSIQMPILPNEAQDHEYVPLFPEAPPRIDAAARFLRARGYTKIVSVAHSHGAAQTAYHLSRKPEGIDAFVAIGMTGDQKDDSINTSKALTRIDMPVLDLYGSEDLPQVLESAPSRKTGAASNPAYRQQVIDGAGHFFDGMNDELVEAIEAFVESL